MSWPDPGTPSEHGAPDDPSHDAPAAAPEDRHEHDPTDGADDGRHDPAAGEDDAGDPGDHGADGDDGTASDEDGGTEPTATYARLRSEVADDLGRWEAEVPAGSSAPHEDATGVVGPEGEEAAPKAADPDGSAPGGTREDALGADVAGSEDSGLGDAGSAPHTPSWRPPSDRPEAPPTPAAPAPAGDPADALAQMIGDGGPFHGEHRGGDEAAATGATGAAFHGEPGPDPATAAGEPHPEVPRSASAVAIEDALAGLDQGDRHATVICVANQKGGVGKTTTTVSLGAALAMLGAQVLVVDLDPQGNATTGLGLRAQEGAPSTYRVIVEQMDVEDAAEPTAVRGLHVLPSSLDLAGAEIELVPAFSRENRLKNALDAVRDLYDVILIDCPPSLGLLTINALVAADQVLVPIQCEYYALEGLGQLMRTVKLVADSLNRGLGVGGVVLTMFDGRTNLSQQVADEVRGYFGDIAYQTIVPRTVRLSEAPSYGQPIGVFDATSRGARAYQRLAREVARRLDLELETEDVSPLDRLLGSSPPTPEEGAPLPTDLEPEDVPTAAEAPLAGPDRHEGPAPDEEDAPEPSQQDAPGQHEPQAEEPHGNDEHHDEHGHDQHEHDEHQHDEHEQHEHDHGHDHGHDQHEHDHGHHQHDEPAPGTEGQP